MTTTDQNQHDHQQTHEHQHIIDFKTAAWQSPQMVETYVSSTERKPLDQSVFNFMSAIYLAHIPSGSKVLDVGCGTGRLTVALHEHGCDVVGSDVSDAMLDVIRQRHPDIAVRQADGHRLPADDGEFDHVTSMDFMPHFPDWPELLAEQARCCAPGGTIVFNFSNREHRVLAEETAKHRHADIYSADLSTEPTRFLAEYDPEELLVACQRIGLRPVQFFPYGFFWNHYNFMIGHSLGPEATQAYTEKLSEFMRNDDVREFAFWVEKNLISHMPAFMTHEHVVICQKL